MHQAGWLCSKTNAVAVSHIAGVAMHGAQVYLVAPKVGDTSCAGVSRCEGRGLRPVLHQQHTGLFGHMVH